MDPTTAKLLAHLAVKLAQDEQARKQILMLIIAPAVAFLLLAAMVLQLLTSPLETLKLWLTADEAIVVDEMRTDYGYTQLVQKDDDSYRESYGQQYEGVVFKDGSREVVYYNQLDSRWADKPYGPRDTIGVVGCGPTSLAIVVSTLTDKAVDPVAMSKWAYDNGYLAEGTGSYHSLIPDGARHFGLKVDGVTVKEQQKIIDALASGKLVIAIMGKGHFTSSGHFIVLRGVTDDGQILVADPASKKRSEKAWDFSIILKEARKNAGAGGPFWIIHN
ncbi:C39 family peptidase [Paenibacillus macerans]|uniref:C39 family peptidase n=1 Tax=Paenibacillus macerans TaxID=44252 RepID=UPI001F11186D|nr:C39 family peptidase [Paenibacillus macerans]MDU5947755.1 C39 family peptidase [Paenibacillus macerans]MEC0140471.1 C39 family peptidase [Paenibacillus macerans]UMV45330.1 C39 family peptidase [Paenibacillus macerans]